MHNKKLNSLILFLELRDNLLSVLDFSNLVNMQSCNLRGNQFTSIDASSCVNIKYLKALHFMLNFLF